MKQKDSRVQRTQQAGPPAFFGSSARPPFFGRSGAAQPAAPVTDGSVIQRQAAETPAGTPRFDLQLTPPLQAPSLLGSADFLSMRRPFFERGVPHLWHAESAMQVWSYNYDFFRRLGLPPSMSISLTNLTAPRFIDAQLKSDHPKWWEITDRELNTSTLGVSLPLLEFNADFSPVAPAWLRSIMPGGGTVQRRCAECPQEER
jgi:hypothetical protein